MSILLAQVSRKSLLFLCLTVGSVVIAYLLTPMAHAGELYSNLAELETGVGGDVYTSSSSTTNPVLAGQARYISFYATVAASSSVRYTGFNRAGGESDHIDCSTGLISWPSTGVYVGAGYSNVANATLVTLELFGTECYLDPETFGGFDEDGGLQEVLWGSASSSPHSWFKIYDTYFIDSLQGTTHIINISPDNNEVVEATTTDDRGEGATTTISVDYEIAEDDVSWFRGIDVTITHKDQNTVYGFAHGSPYSFVQTCEILFDGLVCDAGVYHFEREIWLPSGGYSIHANMRHSFLAMVNPLTGVINNYAESQDASMPMAQYHQYVVGHGSMMSNLRQSSNNRLENILNDPSSSTTASIADCAITEFDFRNCLAFTFIPTSQDVSDFGSKISTTILTKFPAGYAWNFYTILISSTTASLPIIDATIPEGVAGAGAHIRLEINADTLSYLMNATTSQFNNESAPSTGTFVDIVGYYWNIMVYLAVGSYILARVLGSHVIGSLWSEETQPVRSLVGRYREYKNTPRVKKAGYVSTGALSRKTIDMRNSARRGDIDMRKK